MNRTLKTLMAGAALAAAAAPALAEELRGRVTDSFGGQVVIEARGERYLVILPPDAEAPAEGARIRVEGDLDDRTLTARSIALDAGPVAGRSAEGVRSPGVDGPRGPLADAPRGPRLEDRGRGPRGERRIGRGLPPSAPVAAEPPRLPGVSDLTLVETSRSGGRHWTGRLADGGLLRIVIAGDGRLERLASEGQALPRPLIDRLLPTRLSELAEADRLTAITRAEVRRRGEIVLRGPDAEGREIELRYDRFGRFDRAERRLPPVGLDRPAVERILTAAGYTDIGRYDFGPAHAEAVAINPWGERVELRINRHGEIDRERRRDG
ncbi:MAG: hypothetical protein ACK4WC_16130, partial [Rubrimonas sp.]